jgi:hypothetical protein
MLFDLRELHEAPQIIAGDNWRARIFAGYLYVAVAPSVDLGDVLPEVMLPHHHQRFLTEWSHEEDGWDVYLLVHRDYWADVKHLAS